jgi:hypothetical protein
MPQIVWIITTCLQKDKQTSPTPTTFTSYEEREKDYKQGIPSVFRYAHPNERICITENTGITNSFLDEYGVYVHYTNTQHTMFDTNQGKKEFTDVLDCINSQNLDDEDMVIKITGRYILNSNMFPELVRQHLDKDVVYSPENAFKNMEPVSFPNCILGMIAMKSKHWRRLPLDEIKPRIPSEWTVAKYIVDNIPPEKRKETNTLDLFVKIGSSKNYWLV